jgi:hypothetical protein
MAVRIMCKGFYGVSVALVFFTLGCGSDPNLDDGAGGSGNGGSGSGLVSGPVQLGPCQPGFDSTKEPNRVCNWLAGGLCYDTLNAACSCICPLDHPATCVTSYLNATPGGRVPVICG